MSGPDGSSAGRAAGASRRRLVADPIHGPLPALMLVLTLLTGVVDAVSILALNRVFVANMTGNVVFVGFALGGAGGFSLAASLSALGGSPAPRSRAARRRPGTRGRDARMTAAVPPARARVVTMPSWRTTW